MGWHSTFPFYVFSIFRLVLPHKPNDSKSFFHLWTFTHVVCRGSQPASHPRAAETSALLPSLSPYCLVPVASTILRCISFWSIPHRFAGTARVLMLTAPLGRSASLCQLTEATRKGMQNAHASCQLLWTLEQSVHLRVHCLHSWYGYITAWI